MAETEKAPLETVVQRMIDAGEPEENIAAVIKASKSAPPPEPSEADAILHPVKQPGEVTLGDLRDDPAGAMLKIGQSLKRDLTDPKLWMQAAAMYFGPRVLPLATPIIGRAMAPAQAALGEVATPGMAKDMMTVIGGTPRANAAMRIAGRVGNAARVLRGPAPVEPTPAPASAPSVTAAAPSSAPIPDVPTGGIQTPKDYPTLVGPQKIPINKLLSDAAILARRAGTKLELGSPAEAAIVNAVHEGLPVQNAVSAWLIRNASPAEQLLARLPGIKTDAEVRAALDLRNAKGEIKTPSAETARARAGQD